MDRRDAVEARLAIRGITANARMLDAFQFAFEPGTSAAQTPRQRANAALPTRTTTGAIAHGDGARNAIFVQRPCGTGE
jgi:hypothetical protein